MRSLRKYVTIVSVAFANLGEYRFNFVLSIVANIVASFVLFLFWSSMARAGMDVKPYTVETLALYYLFVSTVSAINFFDSKVVAEDIRDGYIAQYLLRPTSYFWSILSASIPDKIVTGIVSLIILLLLRVVGVTLSVSPLLLVLFFVSLGLSVIGVFLVYFVIGLLSFWTKQIHGFSALVSVTAGLVSGQLIPIQLLPDFLSKISYFLPFRYFTFLPVQILLGQGKVGEFLFGLGTQLVWILILYGLYLFVWNTGRKQLEVIGI